MYIPCANACNRQAVICCIVSVSVDCWTLLFMQLHQSHALCCCGRKEQDYEQHQRKVMQLFGLSLWKRGVNDTRSHNFYCHVLWVASLWSKQRRAIRITTIVVVVFFATNIRKKMIAAPCVIIVLSIRERATAQRLVPWMALLFWWDIKNGLDVKAIPT